ncbi:WD40 repeat-like protein, partial [Ramicandelaber brevisporus]
RYSTLDTPAHQLSGHAGAVLSCRFSPDGRHFVSGGADRSIIVWPTFGLGSSESVGYRLGHGPSEGHRGAVTDVAWSPDGECVYSSSGDGFAAMWDAQTGERLARFKCGEVSFRNAKSNTPSMQDLVASASDDGVMRIWDTRVAGNPVQSFTHSYPLTAVANSQTNSAGAVFFGGIDGSIQVYDVRSRSVVDTFEGHTDTISGLSFIPGNIGSFVLSSSMDSSLRLWDTSPFTFGEHNSRMKTALSGAKLSGPEQILSKPGASFDGELVACGGADRVVTIWRTSNNKAIHRFSGHRGCVTAVDIHPSESIILSASMDRTLLLGEFN